MGRRVNARSSRGDEVEGVGLVVVVVEGYVESDLGFEGLLFGLFCALRQREQRDCPYEYPHMHPSFSSRTCTYQTLHTNTELQLTRLARAMVLGNMKLWKLEMSAEWHVRPSRVGVKNTLDLICCSSYHIQCFC